MSQITWTITSTAMTHHQVSALIKSRTDEKMQSSDKPVAPCDMVELRQQQSICYTT